MRHGVAAPVFYEFCISVNHRKWKYCFYIQHTTFMKKQYSDALFSGCMFIKPVSDLLQSAHSVHRLSSPAEFMILTMEDH